VGGSGVEAKDLALLIQNAASKDSKLPNKLRGGLALSICSEGIVIWLAPLRLESLGCVVASRGVAGGASPAPTFGWRAA
jgi:hypothetical protein